MMSLGTQSAMAGSGNTGQIAEDTLFQISSLDGVSSIFIKNSSDGIEVDDLTYSCLEEELCNGNGKPVPEVAPITLLGLGLLGVVFSRRRKYFF